jgi:hypothetical protein
MSANTPTHQAQTLFSPYGQARFEAPATDVAALLARTYQLVPVGSEADHVDGKAGRNGACAPLGREQFQRISIVAARPGWAYALK